MRILSFDQSMARTGVAFSIDGSVRFVASLKLSGTNTVKRRKVTKLVKTGIRKLKPDFVTVERIRLFSGGRIQMQSLVALSSLSLVIVDAASPLEVFSIDTRSWKAKVLGSAKSTKQDAIDFIEGLKLSVENDDEADAACMAIYAARPDALLKLEK